MMARSARTTPRSPDNGSKDRFRCHWPSRKTDRVGQMMVCRWLTPMGVLTMLTGGCADANRPSTAALVETVAKSQPVVEAPAGRQGIVGLWQGTLDTGAIQLRVVFKIKAKPDGSLTGTLDSLDQGAKD